MRLIFKKGVLLDRGASENPHQLALKARLSYPTVAKYAEKPATVQVVDMAVLASLITEGFGLTKRQALDLKLGDLFEIVDD